MLEYLEGLPPATVQRLYLDTRTVLAIYRLLSEIAQYTIRRLILINGASPFEALRGWHPPEFKGIQNPALHQLKKLYILQGRSGEVWINEEFRISLSRAFAGDVETNLVDDSKVIDVGVYSDKRWEDILYGLVTGGSSLQTFSTLKDVLTSAGLTSEGMSLTTEGFQFLLLPRSQQLWRLLEQYLRIAEASGMDVVACVMALCRISLVRRATQVSQMISPIMIQFFTELGLVMQVGNGYLATALVEDLSTLTGSIVTKGYIILETNYKLYAYTSSPLQIAILGLFTQLRDRFQNMVHGSLTGPSVSGAMSKGITAAQIISYLQAHLHPKMTSPGIPPVIQDQIHLWEQERMRLKTGDGFLYQHFVNEDAFKKTVQEATRIHGVLYVNYQKRLLIVKPEAHVPLKSFIKAMS